MQRSAGPEERAPMNVEARSIRGVRITLVANLLSIVAQTAIVAVSARLLTAEQYGLAAGALALVRPIQHLLTAGPERAVLLLPEVTAETVESAFWTLGATGVAVSVAISALALLSIPLGVPGEFAVVLAALAPLVGIAALGAVFRGVLRQRFAFGSLAGADIAGQIIGTGAVTIAAALAGWGVYALVAGFLTQALLQTGVAGACALKSGCVRIGRFRGLRRPGPSPLLSAGISISRTSFLEIVNSQLPTAIIGATLGAAPLGMYNRAAALAQPAIEMIVTTLTRVRIGSVGALRNDPAALRRLCDDLIETAGAATIPLCLGMIAAAPDLAATLLGSAWTGADTAIIWICLSTLPAMLGHVFAVINEGALRLDERFRIQLISMAVAAAGLAAGGLAGDGLAAALAGWAAGWTVFFVLHLRLTADILGASRLSISAHLLPGAVAGFACMVGVFALAPLSPAQAPALRLGLDIVFCALCALLVYAVFFPRVFDTLLRYAGLRPDPEGFGQ